MLYVDSFSHSLIRLFNISRAYYVLGFGNIMIPSTVIPNLMEHMREQEPELNYLELHLEIALQREGIQFMRPYSQEPDVG